MNDTELMLEAISEARLCGQDVPVGCVIARQGEIICRARNMREAAQDPTAHAEIVALRQAAELVGSWRLTGLELYTTLEPCPMCAGAILQARLAKVVFGAYDEIYGAAGSAFNIFIKGRNYPVPEIMGGVEEIQCQTLLKEFFKMRRSEAKG
jgi:tRNA(adenine34) deaminase